MTKRKIHITDVILRDAHQSLIATRMRTEDMLPACEWLDQAGYWSLECWGGATFDACVRFLKEDPWERLRTLRKALPNTRLQMLLRGQNLLGYRHYGDDVVEAFVAKAAENGMDVFRIFDALNDVRNLETSIKAVKKAGKHAQGTICYTVSPVHGTDAYLEQAKAMADMGADSIAIKDMAGLLTPAVTAELVGKLKQTLNLPVFLHSHATSGMAPMCQWAAMEAGVDHIDTALSAFAGGTSHPPTESLVAALHDAGLETGLNLELLDKATRHFREVRKKYHQFESAYNGVDTSVLLSQVPGGMMSNLANQLKEQGALDRIQDVFEEIPRVRKDLGYPPLVTPTSQIVGTQAVINVLAGKRYESITNEVKKYLQGWYGKAPASVDKSLQQRAVGKEDLIEERPANLIPRELDELRKQVGDLATSEEDVLTYAMFPDQAKAYLEQRRDGTLQPEPLEPIPTGSSGGAVSSKFKITVHGESYDIHVTGANPSGENERRFYMTVDGVPEEIHLASLGEDGEGARSSGGRATATKEGHVTTSMPGNIVDVLVKEGDEVQAGDPVLIIEAMKMETEVKATTAGKVAGVFIAKGDRVVPGAVLVEIE
ncbi:MULTISPECIES: sodium-extruding oxaloacetate decarboxylase subunit alpha [unclassified Marinobacter]|uniref:sodium-extruding oxaloacetate decarboxylase subunit alpha n=1 Tax=unclassified Marinobacter TaxID=83889 RepID=UPI00192678BC|nr:MULTISPECIES: sodium-extruding oxaloacetate decarboxylase subunit alpha [unclassified Marinobacter]MBL3823818.1 sodium-extruding oxaloacetate decarboxylase subunit alpha [Marinobacter sp. MC3]MBL3891974.1 sodium-extruding oxaloacetate decarboxylase subunit alpha [Marinobacter sp. MW3]